MKEYYLYLDDSGVLSRKSQYNFFVYGGLLVEDCKKVIISTNYKNKVKQLIRDNPSIDLTNTGELKSSSLFGGHRKYLLNQLKRNCTQVFVIVKIDELTKANFIEKRDVTRYKNYMIRLLVNELVHKRALDDCDKLHILIDNQNIAVSARDSLEDYLFNTYNYDDYYISKTRTSLKRMDFSVTYHDSSHSFLIQAADLIANTKFRRFSNSSICCSEHLQDSAICLKLPHNAKYYSQLSKQNKISHSAD